MSATLNFSRNASGAYTMESWARTLEESLEKSFVVMMKLSRAFLFTIGAPLKLAAMLLRRVPKRVWYRMGSDGCTLLAVGLLLLSGLYSYRHSEVLLERAKYNLVLDRETAAELKCLATTLFWEGERGNEADQRGIAANVFTRMASGDYPSTVCGVVNEVRTRADGTKVAMYSYIFDNRPLPSGKAWLVTQRIAAEELGRWYNGEFIAGSTNYHAPYVAPVWAEKGLATCQLAAMGKIGYHLHYAALSQVQQRACRNFARKVAAKAPAAAQEEFEATPSNPPLPTTRPAHDEVANLLTAL